MRRLLLLVTHVGMPVFSPAIGEPDDEVVRKFADVELRDWRATTAPFTPGFMQRDEIWRPMR